MQLRDGVVADVVGVGEDRALHHVEGQEVRHLGVADDVDDVLAVDALVGVLVDAPQRPRLRLHRGPQSAQVFTPTHTTAAETDLPLIDGIVDDRVHETIDAPLELVDPVCGCCCVPCRHVPRDGLHVEAVLLHELDGLDRPDVRTLGVEVAAGEHSVRPQRGQHAVLPPEGEESRVFETSFTCGLEGCERCVNIFR